MWQPPLLDTVFLRETAINLPYIYLDRWSVLHFCSGILLGFLFAFYYRHKYVWLVLISILIIYEIIERALDNIIFTPENLVDKIWDLIIGLAGFLAAYATNKEKK